MMIAIALAIALLQSVVQGQTMVTVRVGDTANFTLNQPSNCVCTRNQQTVTINGRYGLVNNNDGTANLTISQVTKDDYGLYNCLWNNDINTMIQFSLIVVEPILMDVNQVVYNLNDNMTLTCRVTFYMKSNLMLTADQDLVLSMMLNGRVLIRDNTTSSSVTDVRKRNLTYSGYAVEDMRTYNVTCQLKSNYFSESASQRVYITNPPKATKIANKTDIFYPGQTLVCTVDSYPLLVVSWNKLSAPSCQYPPPSVSPALGMATLTLTYYCLGQQTWSCTATWIDLVTVVNDTITFTVNCYPGYTRCYDNSKCVPINWICDGDRDCVDNSDERDCYRRSTTTTMAATTTTQTYCSGDYVKCYGSSRCVPLYWICDGIDDCIDRSDEIDCYRRPSTTTARTTSFYGRPSSPAVSSARPTISACSIGQMMCLDNSNCIPVTWICNSIQDCADNSDERYCYCGFGQLMCLDGSRCIPVTSVCNNRSDCYDNSDERYCPQISSPTARTTTALPILCTSGFTRCYDNSKCIPIYWICDGGSPDCSDGSDERDCYRRSTTSTSSWSTTTQILTCDSDNTRCYDNSRCIPLRWICDGGSPDCSDGSDEIDCYRRLSTTSTSSTATTPFNRPISCSPGFTRCYDNYNCVPISWICDNFRDCRDNSDETDCYRRPTSTSPSTITTSRMLTCSPGYTRCYDNSKCISVNWICDRDQDCIDNSDEIDCYRRPTTTTTSTRTTTTQIAGCSAGQVKCSNSTQCIPAYWVCDGIRDCSDSSDEINCSRFRDNNRADDRQPLTTPESQPNRTDHTLGKNDHKPTVDSDHHTSEYPREQLTTQESQTRPQAEATDHP